MATRPAGGSARGNHDPVPGTGLARGAGLPVARAGQGVACRAVSAKDGEDRAAARARFRRAVPAALAGLATVLACAPAAAQPGSQAATASAAAGAGAQAGQPSQARETPSGPAAQLGEVEVIGRAEDLTGIAATASEGYVGQQELRRRPLLRVGEVLETVPGLIATQHSGAGKGNQLFLRGFNLDHGTDFATSVAGMPVNLPTHAHGQGYTDVNFLIPELVAHLHFRKGTYQAADGDFSAAGSARIRYFDRLPENLLSVTGGSDDHYRALAAASADVGAGHLLGALEAVYDDGPFERGDRYRKLNAVLRYSRGDAGRGFSVTGMAYGADWYATDQIPERAVAQGRIGRFGTLDPTDGGTTHRISLSARLHRRSARRATEADLYAIDYRLQLYSNFTFFLEDPDNGDQIEQFDRRQVYGLALRHSEFGRLLGRSAEARLGLKMRYDNIGDVGLFRSAQRDRLSTVSDASVDQLSVAPHVELEVDWLPWLRSVSGLRLDWQRFDVAARRAANSGTRDDAILSPKGSLIFGPWADTELYLSAGRGFHSNDARGTVATVDPNSGAPAEPVDPLVPATGVELGLRSSWVPGLRSTFTVFMLQLDSELVFVGDAGTTEPNAATRRFGMEWTNFWQPRAGLTFDFDLAITRARFRSGEAAGERRIPGAIPRVIATGVHYAPQGGPLRGFSGSLRVRHFGDYPLAEDNSVREDATTLVNLALARSLGAGVEIGFTVLNLFDAKASDIAFFETTRLPGEPAEGVDDRLFHPVLPRQFRGTVTMRF